MKSKLILPRKTALKSIMKNQFILLIQIRKEDKILINKLTSYKEEIHLMILLKIKPKVKEVVLMKLKTLTLRLKNQITTT